MTVEEYNTCVDDFSDGIYRFILKNIRDEDEAQDIVQESYMRMWERVNHIQYQKARSYLFTTAYHTMIDRLRKNNRLSPIEEAPEHETRQHNNYSDLSEVLSKAVDTLPVIQKNVVLLRDYEGYSYKEIGEITDLNESQVKVYIYRARKALRNYIGSVDKVL
ncbi:MAG: RNA polymerase sigma factor [Bacteroidales bacterium]|nr:RNA polymerase sigma factor [Bacteroidales bacterium]MCF8337085.1 RNA polymerase sigma factor [Bacteroidales bacterium]